MSKHTPGLWKFVDTFERVETADDRYIIAYIAGGLGSGIFREQEQVQANARLIAAAPELLAFIEELVAHDHEKYCSATAHCAVCVNGTALIRKAKGE